MGIKTILAPLNGLASTSPALEFALRLARRFDAHVEACHVARDPREGVAFLGEGMTGSMIEEIMAIAEREGKERAARARAMFEETCARLEAPLLDPGTPPEAGFSASCVTVTGREEEHVARRGRLADLIVIDRPDQGEEASRSSTLEAALRETGRPVAVVPPETREALCRCVAIAWNGTIEAGRAIAAALPLLAGADRILVLSVGEEGKPGSAARDVVEYLAWHGIEAAAETLDAGPRSVGASLLDAATAAGADLLVMGAYTRSRLHRLIFGNVTGAVLKGAEIPVVMVH